jgi:hypothetical protein
MNTNAESKHSLPSNPEQTEQPETSTLEPVASERLIATNRGPMPQQTPKMTVSS